MEHLQMDYNTVFLVMDSWELLRRIDDYETVAGLRLFEILFTMKPQAKTLFGIADDEAIIMKDNRHFAAHAKLLVSMIDRSLQMLGPDDELLAEILTDLGKKHLRLGVPIDLFEPMGYALILTIQEKLGSSWSSEMETAWKEVYGAMTLTMTDAMNTDKVVIESWAKMKERSNFQETGVLLFKHMFDKCPETKTLFGFLIDAEISVMHNSRRFKTHAGHFVEMLDLSIEMVEAKKLQENMSRLGVLHNSYGVKAEYFDIMRDALFHCFESILKEDWNDTTRQAWQHVYGKMASQMLAAMEAEKK